MVLLTVSSFASNIEIDTLNLITCSKSRIVCYYDCWRFSLVSNIPIVHAEHLTRPRTQRPGKCLNLHAMQQHRHACRLNGWWSYRQKISQCSISHLRLLTLKPTMGPRLEGNLVRPVIFKRRPTQLLAAIGPRTTGSIVPHGAIVKGSSKKEFGNSHKDKRNRSDPNPKGSILRAIIESQHFPKPRGSVLREILESHIVKNIIESQHFPKPRGSVLTTLIELHNGNGELIPYTGTHGNCKTSWWTSRNSLETIVLIQHRRDSRSR